VIARLLVRSAVRYVRYFTSAKSPSLTGFHHSSVSDDRAWLRTYLSIFSYRNGLDLNTFPCVDISLLANRLLR
jgi:hypothetical protein